MKKLITMCAVVAMVMAIGSSAQATIGYFEGFESGIGDWNPYDSSLAAIGGNLQITDPVTGNTGAFSRLGGYVDTFGNGFTTKADVYIDLTDARIDAGTYGFDMSQGINNNAGDHAQDNIFHVGAVDDGTGNYDVLLNASHNSDFVANSYKLKNEQGGNYTTFTESGWYTFEFNFAVSSTPDKVDITFGVYDSVGDLFWSAQELSQDAQYTLSNVGGHRYMWFTFVDAEALLVDNAAVVPEPATVCLLGLGGLLIRRKRRA